MYIVTESIFNKTKTMIMIISIIAAMDANRVIGLNGKIPWHLPKDLKRFKRLTTGMYIVMGRKTHESIGRVLPNRVNIVLTRQKELPFPDCCLLNNLQLALDIAESNGKKELFIIGGAEIYKEALPIADKMYLTEIDAVYEGDAFFPEFDKSEWEEVKREAQFDMGMGYSFVEYLRRI